MPWHLSSLILGAPELSGATGLAGFYRCKVLPFLRGNQHLRPASSDAQKGSPSFYPCQLEHPRALRPRKSIGGAGPLPTWGVSSLRALGRGVYTHTSSWRNTPSYTHTHTHTHTQTHTHTCIYILQHKCQVLIYSAAFLVIIILIVPHVCRTLGNCNIHSVKL